MRFMRRWSLCRCRHQVHRARNILSKIPAGMQAEVKDAYWAVFDTSELKTPPGPKLVEIIDNRISAMAARYRTAYPSATKCLTTDRQGLTAYLRFPAEHHKRIRHANFIEHLRRDSAPHQGHRPAARRDQLPHPGVGRPEPGLGRLARPGHDRRGTAAAARPAPLAAPATPPAAATHRDGGPAR